MILLVRSEFADLTLDTSLMKAGMRVAVGVSGGADSVALLWALHGRAGELGIVLRVAHLHHGLRGAEADGDLEFVRALAERLGLPFLTRHVDVAAEAVKLPGKPAETIEEAARRVRYAWFRELMGGTGNRGFAPQGLKPQTPKSDGDAGAEAPAYPLSPADVFPDFVDAVATAHTLDDQAETVMAKVLRGAWTEGIAGIHPVVEFAEGRVIRPLLGTRRAEVEAYLRGLGQEWREDSSNRHLTFTRNRIRHELLPVLEGWNPKLKEHLAQMAELARDEESWWQAEVARVAPEVMLVGRPVRGGGRAAAEGLVVLEVSKLAGLEVALQRRIVRYAVERLGAGVDFAGTEKLRELALTGRAGQKCELGGGVRAERSHRELRLSIQGVAAEKADESEMVDIPVPGEGVGFGVQVRIEMDSPQPSALSSQLAVLRNWKAGDRVHLRHSSGPRKVKEVLERMKVSGSERAKWPVLELNGRIVWMRGAAVEAEAGVRITVTETGG
jgi:tRNA(Ile)-lysidine synthase